MKKFLPQTKSNLSGFTLIELLVVISIIAILSVIGLAVFSGVQKNARDARRREDITAIAQALEANKTMNSPTYNVLANSQFQSGSIPQDTTTAKYCAAFATTTTAPGIATAWTAADQCPTAPTAPAGYTVISGTNPPATAVSWTLCALLEDNTFLCRSNSQ